MNDAHITDSLIIKYILVSCFLISPIWILAVKKTAPELQRSLKLIFPLFLFTTIICYTTFFYNPCPVQQSLECFAFKTLLFSIACLVFVMFLGWFEYISRRLNKTISWPFYKRFNENLVSNIFIFVSGLVTLLVILVFTIYTAYNLFF